MTGIMQASIVDHIQSSQDNMFASLDIYKNFEKALAAKTYAWTQKIYASLVKEESLADWHNRFTRANDIGFNYKYACPCFFTPSDTAHVGVAVELQGKYGEQALIGVWLDKPRGEKENLREAMTTFFQQEFHDRYTRNNPYWPCYEFLLPPYHAWMEKELITQLYDDTNIMLYSQIRELCKAVQKFLTHNQRYAQLLRE